MKFLDRWMKAFSSKHISPTSSQEPPTVTGDESPHTTSEPIENATLTYSTDQPIKSSSDDRFGRYAFAKRLADTIATRQDIASLVIGLYGKWGDGKTSVLFMLEERLEAYKNIITVRFNPWHFASEEKLLTGFFATLSSAIGKELPTRGEKLGKILRDYGSLLSLGSLTIGGIVQVNPGQAATELGKSMSNVDIDELHKRIDSLLGETGKHVVVLIDDIDRLDREETHAIFKLVKRSAGFNHTSYMLAFDETVVSADLGERYGAGGYAAGRAFLEKIVQVPLHLPPADPIALRKLAFDGINECLNQADIELKQSDADTFVRLFVDGIEPRFSTPRQARLYTNALMFVLPLVKGEVNIVDLLMIEGIRVFYPELYSVVRRNPSLFLDRPDNYGSHNAAQAHREELTKVLLENTPSITDREREQLRSRLLEHLFPRIGNAGYGDDWNRVWARDKRICSQEYFKRYFSYGVPIDDVSDRAIDSFIDNLPNLRQSQQDESLRALVGTASASLVRKLRQREELISAINAVALCLTLARNGNLFLVERGPFVMGGTRAQAAIFISHLLRNISDHIERSRLAVDLVQTASPLPFACECLRWLEPRRDEAEDQWLLNQEVRNRVTEIISERIRGADQETPIFVQFGREARSMYWIWRDTDHTRATTQTLAHFMRAPELVDPFLDIFVGESWGMESGLPSRSDFDRRDYNDIAALVDPNAIADNLRERYGTELTTPSYHQDDSVDLARRIAHQYVFIHNAVLSEQASSDDAGTGTQEDQS